jgi:hypothetical protein
VGPRSSELKFRRVAALAAGRSRPRWRLGRDSSKARAPSSTMIPRPISASWTPISRPARSRRLSQNCRPASPRLRAHLL